MRDASDDPAAPGDAGVTGEAVGKPWGSREEQRTGELGGKMASLMGDNVNILLPDFCLGYQAKTTDIIHIPL